MTQINGTLAPWSRNPVTGRFEGGTVWAGFSELRHGVNVNIVGTGFGSVPQFAFAGGRTGRIEQAAIGLDNVNSGGFFLSYERPKYIVDDAERGKVWKAEVWDGSTAAADNGIIAHDWGSDIPVGSKILRHFVTKINCDATYYQWKFWRQEPFFNFSDGGPECFTMFWKKTSSPYFGVRPELAGDAVTTYFNGNKLNLNNEWFGLDYYQVVSDVDTFNGVDYGVSNLSSGVNTLFDLSNSKHIGAGLSQRPRWQVLQNYIGNYDEGTPTIGDVYVDDFYVQVAAPGTGLIRVYLCNTSDFSTSTIREIQRPLSDWNNTNAPVEINRGAMPNGQCWLIVVANKNTQLQATECQLID